MCVCVCLCAWVWVWMCLFICVPLQKGIYIPVCPQNVFTHRHEFAHTYISRVWIMNQVWVILTCPPAPEVSCPGRSPGSLRWSGRRCRCRRPRSPPPPWWCRRPPPPAGGPAPTLHIRWRANGFEPLFSYVISLFYWSGRRRTQPL